MAGMTRRVGSFRYALPKIITHIEQELSQKGVLVSFLESVCHNTSKGVIEKGDLGLWFANYKSVKDRTIEDVLNKLSEYGIEESVDVNGVKEFYSFKVLAYQSKMTEEFPEPNIKNPESPTKSDLKRLDKHFRQKTDMFINQYANDIAKTMVHIEMLESVLEQLISDDIDFVDFVDWYENWNKLKNSEDIKAAHATLGMENIQSWRDELDQSAFVNMSTQFTLLQKEYLDAA